MKKITFILLMLISGTVFGQKTADATAAVKAEIVKPIGITNLDETVLNFGKLLAPTSGDGTSVIAAVETPASATLNNLTAFEATPTITTAKFEITASANYLYNIIIDDVILDGPDTATMTLVPAHSATEFTGDQTLFVGGTLTVKQDQKEGSYEGLMTVTVTYQ